MYRIVCRLFTGDWEIHMEGSSEGKAGQREKLTCNVIAMKASNDPVGVLYLWRHSTLREGEGLGPYVPLCTSIRQQAFPWEDLNLGWGQCTVRVTATGHQQSIFCAAGSWKNRTWKVELRASPQNPLPLSTPLDYEFHESKEPFQCWSLFYPQGLEQHLAYTLSSMKS